MGGLCPLRERATYQGIRCNPDADLVGARAAPYYCICHVAQKID